MIRFQNWDCIIEKEEYASNDRTCLTLLDQTDGGVVAVATVNLPATYLAPGEVIIKNYSENEGIYEALLGAGVIGNLKSIPQPGCFVCDLIKSALCQ